MTLQDYVRRAGAFRPTSPAPAPSPSPSPAPQPVIADGGGAFRPSTPIPLGSGTPVVTPGGIPDGPTAPPQGSPVERGASLNWRDAYDPELLSALENLRQMVLDDNQATAASSPTSYRTDGTTSQTLSADQISQLLSGR